MADVSTSTSSGTSWGVPVGAVVAPPQLVQPIRRALMQQGWLKAGKCVSPYQSGSGVKLLAVHLNHRGVCALIRDDMPKELRHLLETGEGGVSFVPGLRLGARIHDGGAEGNREGPSGGRFSFIELFAGIGGFRCALEEIGGSCAFASEIDPEARGIYRLNFPSGGILAGDITEVWADEIPDHDILTAGFCCQSFSRAGDRLGLEDDRGLLFFEIVRVLRERRPKGFLLENVSYLIEHEEGQTFYRVLEELGAAGYLVTFRVVNSSALLPQRRQRLYFVGFRDDLQLQRDSFRWPALPLLDRCVSDILEDNSAAVEESRLTDHQWAKIQESAIYKEDSRARAAMLDGHARTLMASYKRGYYMHSEFVFDSPGCKPRFFTPRECARLMGFPEGFRGLCGNNRSYHQLGNAVCPPVVAALGEALVRALELGAKGETHGHLEPALRLLASASPEEDPDRQRGHDRRGHHLSPSLRSQIEAALSESSTGRRMLPFHMGYSTDITEGGCLMSVAELLHSEAARAQMAALRDIARMTSKPGLDKAPSNRRAVAGRRDILRRLMELAKGTGGSPPLPCPFAADLCPAGVTGQPLQPHGREGSRKGQVGFELRRLALVAITNLASGGDVAEQLEGAGVRQLLLDLTSRGSSCFADVTLRQQAAVALEALA